MEEPDWSDAPFDEEFDEDLRHRIKAEVDPDEPVLWAGRPVPGPTPIGAGTVVFTIIDLALVAAVAACVVYAVRSGPNDARGAVVLAIFAFMFAGFITLGLVTAARRREAERTNRARTSYALTARRAIIWRPFAVIYGVPTIGRRGGIEVYSIPRPEIAPIHRVEYPDGTGDLLIKRRGSDEWGGSHLGGIAGIRPVERLFRDVLRVGDANEELREIT